MAFNTDSDSYSLSIEHSDESHEGSKQANNQKRNYNLITISVCGFVF